MYTRCKDCHTVHPVNAALLAQGGGKYRCGKCNKLGNALESIFDEWPGAGDQPASAGELPVLGLSLDLEMAEKSRLAPAEAALSGEEEAVADSAGRTGGKLLRFAWITALSALVIVSAFKLSEFRGRPVLDHPLIQSTMVRLGLREPPASEPFRSLSEIQLISRELRSHPTRAGVLRLTATIVNVANEKQPYPILDVILLDVTGQPVTNKSFAPADYLAKGARQQSGMTPEAYLSLVLELDDPGNQAVGFELQFR